MIGEVQKARPLAAADIQSETWYGPHTRYIPTDPNTPKLSPTVPLFRVEF